MTDSVFARCVRSYGAVLYDAQLWTPTENCATQVLAFRDVAQIVDRDQIGTHSDGATVECVLAGIRKRGTPQGGLGCPPKFPD